MDIGDSPEQVTEFKVDRSLVMDYLDDAHEATTRRLSTIPAGRFDQLVIYAFGDNRAAWRALVAWQVIQHSTLGKIPIW